MALSRIEIEFLARLACRSLLKTGGSLLELGESVCSGGALEHVERFRGHADQPRLVEAARAIAAAEASRTVYRRSYGAARAIYNLVFAPTFYLAVDILPGPRSIWADLNRPLHLGRQFDTVVNNGLSEHVFDQANVFRTIHEHTCVGGLMIHWTPTLGWTGHGIYNVHPDFFFDLATANGYTVEHIELGGFGRSHTLPMRGAASAILREEPRLVESLLCAALRKTADKPFVPPMQGQVAALDPVASNFASAFAAGYNGGWRRTNRPNLALSMPARQSSTCQYSWHDDPAIDAEGANNGVVTGSYGFHTDIENRPWWSVDLGRATPLREIVVFNRMGDTAVMERAGRLQITTSIDGSTWEELVSYDTLVKFGGADGNPLRVLTNRLVTAQHVKLELLGRDYFHLDEIEIY